MLQSSIVGCRPANCYRHKTQPASHICTQQKCNNNPVLCALCFRDQLNRTYHFDHERSILPYQQAISTICTQIKSQTLPMQKIYKSTLGRTDFGGLLLQLQKGSQLYDQVEDKIISIKSQVELEVELLVKQFQRLVIAEKQEYFKMLDNYQKSFAKNFEYLKSHAQTIMQFNNSVKYYSNKNNLHLKLNSESRKKSDWLQKTKKLLQHSQKQCQNSSTTNELSTILNTYQRLKMDIIPIWRSDENSTNERISEIKNTIRKIMNQWVDIPDIKNLQDQIVQGGNYNQQQGNKNYYY